MKRIFGLITICSVLALPVLAASPANFGGNGTAWENDYGQHYVNTNNPDLRMDWDNQYFAVPGEGGHHADENAAVEAHGSGSLVKPRAHLVEKIPLSSFTEETQKGKKTHPGQGKKPSEQKDATGILGATSTGEKYAVVIGICDYPGTDHDICDSDGDALNMYDALVHLYGYDSSNIYLFRDMATDTGSTTVNGVSYTSEPAIYSEIKNAVKTIGINATSGSEVTFFFSGHGGWADDNDASISGNIYPGDEADGRDEVIWVHNGLDKLVPIFDDELVSWFSDFETSRIPFVFDSCLAGGMDDVAADGRVVSMATGEHQSAYVYSQGERGEGVFSHYFANEGMLQGLADGDNQIGAIDGDVAVEEAFDYAKDNIPPYLKHRQKPVISDDFTDDLLL